MSDRPNDQGLSRKHITEQCHASLRRLGTDYVDLYQCHRYDENTPLEETLRALDDLVRQGKVLYWGVSNYSGWQLMKMLAIAEHQSQVATIPYGEGVLGLNRWRAVFADPKAAAPMGAYAEVFRRVEVTPKVTKVHSDG